MSHIIQGHITQKNIKQQRMMKSQSGENSNPGSPGILGAGSPGALSPFSMGPSSPQGMPIPRRALLPSDQHWIFNPNGLVFTSASNHGNSNWNGMMIDSAMESIDGSGMAGGGGYGGLDSMSMEGELSKLSMAVDDDDIFKVERNDLLGPTLAELNAPDADTLLDGLNFDDLYWPDGGISNVEASPSPQTPAGASALDPEDTFVPFQVQQQPMSSSLPPMGGYSKFHVTSGGGGNVGTSSVPATILEQTLLQPILLTSGDITYSPQPSPSPCVGGSSSSGGLRELLLRRELQNSIESPEPSPLGQSLPRTMLTNPPGSPTPRLSSSAPSSEGANVWEAWQQRREAGSQRRDPRPHLLSTGSLAEAGSSSSLGQDVMSPGRDFSLSMDEGFDSDEISDRDSSDEDSEASDTESNAGSTSGTRRERFFWQYNVQAKGPKGQRLVLAPTQEDPHVLQRPTDPVFSPLCHIQGIKHSGKARKGDGNDLTPNPRKLWAIGKELDRLNKIITEMTPVADLPNAVKTRSRKEKNKLASRACRLKKKAQHEANKLKLYGLEQEHKRLMQSIQQARHLVFSKMDGTSTDEAEPLSAKIERLAKSGSASHKVGGHTTEFVNRVLEKVKQGVPDGGINEI